MSLWGLITVPSLKSVHAEVFKFQAGKKRDEEEEEEEEEEEDFDFSRSFIATVQQFTTKLH